MGIILNDEMQTGVLSVKTKIEQNHLGEGRPQWRDY